MENYDYDQYQLDHYGPDSRALDRLLVVLGWALSTALFITAPMRWFRKRK